MSAMEMQDIFEIWYSVFRDITEWLDLVHMWTECRQVSRMFRNQVEHVFQIVHIPKTKVLVNLGDYHLDDGWPMNYSLKNINFCFDQLASDETRAIYKLKLHERSQTKSSEIVRRLSPGGTTAATPFVERVKIKIQGQINDTQLPSFTFDNQRLEIYIDWRGAFANFFAEEKLYNVLYDKMTALRLGARAWSDPTFKESAKRGICFIACLNKMHTNLKKESRKDARRRRIHRQWRESGLDEKQISARQDDEIEQKEMDSLDDLRRLLNLGQPDHDN